MTSYQDRPTPRAQAPIELDLAADPAELTAALIDVPSESGNEAVLADAVERALRALPRLEVVRVGNTVMARTHLGRPTRVLVAGHLDTVPIADNVPSHVEGDEIFGCGATDMKSGDAMLMHLVATMANPGRDITAIFYDCEEVERARNGLNEVEARFGDWLTADLAILSEPTNGIVEAGCQGSLSFRVETSGARAHAARSWLGLNAIHAAAPVLQCLTAYDPRTVDVDGCQYREGLNAVGIEAGIANNVIPDRCTVKVNFRYAPDRSEQDAKDHVRQVFHGFELEFTDSAPPAPPGLDAPAAAEFVAVAGGEAVAKYGWTDVSRFAARGIPAVNYGPGDSGLAHTPGEHVSGAQIRGMTEVLRRFIG